ncbi:MAG TPA: endo alpha-1,4 polygalactosaminidase [Baekduia sp.]
MMTTRLLFVGVAACATFSAAAAAETVQSATSSTTTSQTVQAESLHVPGHSGRVVHDRSAAGRRALALTGVRAAHARVRVRQASQVQVVARASGCMSVPRLVVAVDGKRVLSAGVTTRQTWSVLRTTAVVAAGARTVSVQLANPHHAKTCRRNVHIDRISFVAPRAGTNGAGAGGGPSSGAAGSGAAGAAPGAAATPAPKSSTAPAATAGRWSPAPRTTWQWQLSGTVDQSVAAQMYDVDLFDTPASTVASLHAQGRRVVCYVDAGTYEPGRPDSGSIPAAVQGSAVEGWPGERWLDVRRLDVLGPILEKRLDLCKSKGFDGVEPDNVDGYSNSSGFPLSAADQLAFNRFIASAAHARGLSVGLKNDLDQAATLQPDFDWALNEQCYQYSECDMLQPFAKAGKAVFVAEYDTAPSTFCGPAAASGYSAIRKNMDLDAWRETC